MDNLLFRRQFILSQNESKNFGSWSKRTIGSRFYLYCHPELQISYVKKGEREIYLLGYILDPFNPRFTNDRILEETVRSSASFKDVLAHTGIYSGRWVLIWKDNSGIKIFNDACGTRQVYYYTDNNSLYCGSQPSIIAYELGLKESISPELKEFIDSKEYKSECAWIGDGTTYNNLWHMLPNHYLDMDLKKAQRFWPNAELPPLEMSIAVKEAANIIRGTISAVFYRFRNVMLSVTAGLDSRINLAASKPFKDKTMYFLCTEDCSKRNVDYRVSSKLLHKLQLKQRIIGLYDVNNEFEDTYKKNVTMASELPSKSFIYSFYKDLPDYIHISGVGAEITRNFYNHNNIVSKEKFSKAAKYRNLKYAESFIEKWLKDAEDFRNLKTINVLDLFYWEQRVGNWAAKSSAEQDIAIEETWPYNNRSLLTMMLSVDPKYRKPPFYKFHRLIIKYLWKEALCMPINPNFKKKLYGFLKGFINSMEHTLLKLKNKLHRNQTAGISINN